MPFRRVDKRIAYEAVRHEIVEMIKSDELKVGDRLPSEVELAASFGVSRPVVREALGSLRALGLVQSENGRGSFVSSARPPLLLGSYSVQELHEVRCALEIPTAALAAQRCAGECADHLRTTFESLSTCEDRHEWVELDAAFHRALAQATNNRVLVELTEHILGSVRELSYSLAVSSRRAEANEEHRRVVDAVLAGDEQAAETAMRAHLLAVRRTVVSTFGEEEWATSPDTARAARAQPSSDAPSDLLETAGVGEGRESVASTVPPLGGGDQA